MTPVVVIPAFNEAATLETVVSGARAYAPVVVVDDGSDDGSGAIAARAGAEVVRHRKRRGKAAALRSGIAVARGWGASWVITLDGDGQHAAADLGPLLRAARETPDWMIVGNRLVDARQFPRGRLNAMRVTAFFVEWVSGLGIHDTQSGLRVYPMALLDDVPLARPGFVFETEVLIAAAWRGWRVREVPVTAIPSARRRSRFRPVRDGVAIGAYIAEHVTRRAAHEAKIGVRSLAARLGGLRLRGNLEAHVRLRRATVVATAALATPMLLAAAVGQVMLGRLSPDLVTPLVRRLYALDRLTSLTGPVETIPADLSGVALVTSPLRRS
jgi:glycosyltransferase involved in cell wall biosynthesis